jgi:small subunit ribosomal protein S1
VEERYHPGDVITTTITRIVDFGAFAELEPGIEGLIHISEIADIAVAEPLKTIRVGDEVQAKVLRVDRKRQRVGLSLRQAEGYSSSAARGDDDGDDDNGTDEEEAEDTNVASDARAEAAGTAPMGEPDRAPLADSADDAESVNNAVNVDDPGADSAHDVEVDDDDDDD